MLSICSILADAAAEFPDKRLFVFPETRWRPAESRSYAELASRAGGAARVISAAARPGERALLLFPTGPAFWEAFLGCLAGGVVAVPLKTPNLNRTSDHLERVIRDCAPATLIADEATADLLRKRGDMHPYVDGVTVLTPVEWRDEQCDLKLRHDGGDLAYLQYTSGSTSHPKGVQISHANLMSNAAMIRECMEVRSVEDSTVTWLPHYHDMGLIGSYLGTLYNRLTAWCLPPDEFALHPQCWLQLISQHRATICGGPHFGFRYCVDKIKDEDLAGIDLSCWRVAYIGAERIQPETVRRFSERFTHYGFRHAALFPCYGLGEATLLVTGGPAAAPPVSRTVSRAALQRHLLAPPVDEVDALSLAGCGQVGDGCAVVIGDPATGNRLPDESIGEVLVSGPAVTRGYFNRHDENDQLFREVVIDGEPQRFLRTGDLGFLSHDELYITGRLKEMMIVRGRNLYPDDLEPVIDAAHEALAPGRAVTFSVECDGQESLIIAAEVRRSAVRLDSGAAVFAAIRARIVERFGVNPHEIVLLPPATIPSTSSGKLQRLAVRDEYAAGRLGCLFREHPAATEGVRRGD
jgi:acyl-CoA synthetase (AMP-forming)/AMP-acid ligase II